MSYMSTLATAGITVEEMATYLAEHPGVTFDEAVRAIQERHTGEGGKMKAPKHHTEGFRVLVGRVEVARFTDKYQAERFVKFIEEKDDIPRRGRDDGDAN